MNDKRTVAAAAGFAFVAAWIGFGFGEAILCLLGAAVFWVAAGVLTGSVDVAALQRRFAEDHDAPTVAPAPAAAPRPQASPRVR